MYLDLTKIIGKGVTFKKDYSPFVKGQHAVIVAASRNNTQEYLRFELKNISVETCEILGKYDLFDYVTVGEKAGEDLAHNVAEFVNSFSCNSNIKEFINTMGSEHRTLQQSFTKLCVNWLSYLACLPLGYYDGRNEASVMLAKEIVRAVDDRYFYLPLV